MYKKSKLMMFFKALRRPYSSFTYYSSIVLNTMVVKPISYTPKLIPVMPHGAFDGISNLSKKFLISTD